MNFKDELRKLPHMPIEIIIPEDKCQLIKKFVINMVNEKTKENHYKFDNNQLYKRHYTGKIGEVAVEIYLKKEYVDYTIGNSINYDICDLCKLIPNIGVKTVELGKFHVVNKRITNNEILTIKKLNENSVVILGLATIDILRQHTSDDCILSPDIKRRGIKTGFYGYQYLKKFKNLEDLKQLITL